MKFWNKYIAALDTILFSILWLLLCIGGLVKLPILLYFIALFTYLIIALRKPVYGLSLYLMFYYNYPVALNLPFPFQITLALVMLSSIKEIIVHKVIMLRYSVTYVISLTIIFLVYCFLTIIWAKFPEIIKEYSAYLITSLLTLLMFILGIRSAEDRFMLLKHWGIWGALGTITGFLHSLVPISYMRSELLEKNVTKDFTAIEGMDDIIRWVPPFKEPNYYATTLLIPLAINFGILLIAKNKKKISAAPWLLLSLLGITFAYSRSTYLSVLVIFMLYIIGLKGINRFYVIVGSIATAIISIIFLPTSIFDRLSSIGENIVESGGTGRFNLFSQAITLFIENPINGIGYWQFFNYASFAAHNTYLEFLVSYGIVGVIPFILIIVMCIRILKRTLVKLSLEYYFILGVVGYMVNLNTVSLFNYSDIFIVVGIICSLAFYGIKENRIS